MDILRIEHTDFTLTVESTRFVPMWQKGVGNLGEGKLTSTYRWSEGVKRVVLLNEEGKEQEIKPDEATEKALFFEQTDYSVWVDFVEGVTDARFDSARKDVNEQFSWKANKQLLAGFLNYCNEIGRADMPISYTLNGEQKRFVFSYDVISAKLDYHHDWKQILSDIEQEYRMLSLDYLRRTYHNIGQGEGKTFDIVWWNVFQGQQTDFINACHRIIDRPRHRLRTINTYERADTIRHFTPQLEQEFTEHRSEESRLYRVGKQQNTYNTIENRFLKHALLTIEQRYSTLAKRVKAIDHNIAEGEMERIDQIENELAKLKHNPFFRTVGIYEGLKQESLVLQRDVNYSKIYRTFNILQKSFSLNDGIYRMETKNIATLYEIWCFIQVEKIVKELTDIDPEQHDRSELNGLFTYNLGKGDRSKIVFKKDNVTLAELMYNPWQDEKTDDIKGISNLVAPTVPQKPDIVLQLTKDDVEKGMKMTYLFDAKYRIDKKDSNNVDLPPEDAINQMHRFRDAIYYRDYDSQQLKKEVIGGYILFPGDGDPTEVQMSKFYQSIQEVNIGAFPLRPKNEVNRKLLEQFIKDLIETKSAVTISKVIPQKGTTVFVPNRVLIGLVSPSPKRGYNQSFEDGNADLYYTGPNFPSTIALHDLHFFIPYFKDKGIRDVYEITKIRTIKGSEAKQLGGGEEESDDIRLAFHLRFHHKTSDEIQRIDTSKMINYTFIDTNFEELETLILNE